MCLVNFPTSWWLLSLPIITAETHFIIFTSVPTKTDYLRYIICTFTNTSCKVRTLSRTAKMSGHMIFWLAEKSKVLSLWAHVVIHWKISKKIYSYFHFCLDFLLKWYPTTELIRKKITGCKYNVYVKMSYSEWLCVYIFHNSLNMNKQILISSLGQEKKQNCQVRVIPINWIVFCK